MSTVKVIPRKNSDTVVCDTYIDNLLDASEFENKTYPTLPSDSAWFEKRIGQVVEVEIEIITKQVTGRNAMDNEWCPSTQVSYAIPPKQDLWDEAMQLLHSHNPFTARKAKLIFEILQNNGYTLQKK